LRQERGEGCGETSLLDTAYAWYLPVFIPGSFVRRFGFVVVLFEIPDLAFTGSLVASSFSVWIKGLEKDPVFLLAILVLD
jgi:hypothetical protein